jgi:hypothetical protein
LNWPKSAVKELDKLNHNRSSRVLRNDSKVLIKKIKNEMTE